MGVACAFMGGAVYFLQVDRIEVITICAHTSFSLNFIECKNIIIMHDNFIV